MQVLQLTPLKGGEAPSILVSDCDYSYLSQFTWHWDRLEQAPYRVIHLSNKTKTTRWLTWDLTLLACGRPRTLIPINGAIYDYQRSRFRLRTNAKKPYHGVSYSKPFQYWVARIIVDKTRWVSRTGFKSANDAAYAHDLLCMQHGRLDCLNFAEISPTDVHLRAFENSKNGRSV